MAAPAETRELTAAEQENLHEAGYQAQLTRTLAFWLWVICALAGWAFASLLGFMLIVAAVILWVAVPVRLLQWHGRIAALPAGREETRECRAFALHAFLLWLVSPAAFGLIALVVWGWSSGHAAH